jgi:hypothetical protein
VRSLFHTIFRFSAKEASKYREFVHFLPLCMVLFGWQETKLDAKSAAETLNHGVFAVAMPARSSYISHLFVVPTGRIFMDNQNVSPIGNAGALSLSQNRVLRNTFALLAVSLIPTVIGASLGLAVNFRGFGAWWMNLLIMLGAVMAFSYAVERTKNSGLGVAFCR